MLLELMMLFSWFVVVAGMIVISQQIGTANKHLKRIDHFEKWRNELLARQHQIQERQDV